MAKDKNKKDEMQPEAVEQSAPETVDIAAIKAQAEQEAMEKVLKKLGINAKELDELERIKKDGEELIDYNIGNIDVYVNGNVVPGQGRVPRAEAEQILSLAANKRHRLMQEVFGKKGMADLARGQIFAEIAVKEIEDISGQKVSQ
jgi:NACalpha-BTF3-like transcription factor